MIFQEALENVANALVRLAGFTAGGFLLGLPVVLLLVVRPGFRAAPEEAVAQAAPRLAARLEGFVRASLWAAAAAAAVALVLHALALAQIGTGAFGTDSLAAVDDSSFGRWHLVRFPVIVALAILLVGKVKASSLGGVAGTPGRAPGPIWWGAWITLALVLVATSSFSGHAYVSSPRVLAVANDIVHLAAGAIWFSGVVILASAAPHAWRTLSPHLRTVFLTPLVVRFSRVALAAIAVIAATGTGNSFFNLESPGDLVDSGYGGLLLSKIVVFLVVVVLGGINHFYVRSRLTRSTEDDATRVRGLFRKTIAMELALALGLFVVTSALVGSARTRPSESPTAEISARD